MEELRRAVENKISALEDEIEELKASLERAEYRRSLYVEILEEDFSVSPSEKLPSSQDKGKRRGRPSKPASVSKETKPRKKIDSNDALYEQSLRSLPEAPTTPEQQAKAKLRFSPTPRIAPSYGGVVVNQDKRKGHTSITVDDTSEEE